MSTRTPTCWETERTWDYLERSERQYRPVPLAAPEEEGVTLQFWLVDGKVRGNRFPLFSQEEMRRRQDRVGRRFADAREARELSDVGLRLEHMDATGVDVPGAAQHHVHRAGDRPGAGGGGAVRELEPLARRYLVAFRGTAALVVPGAHPEHCGRLGSDPLLQGAWRLRGADAGPSKATVCWWTPYFYPIYEEASRLDMAIAVHIANGSAWLDELYRHPVTLGAFFHRFRIPTVGGFAYVLFSELPDLFPKLRWGFIEASAQWVPWILHEARNRFRTRGLEWPDNPMEAFRLFVTCENSDDLPYIVRESGEDGLVIGTDYGHTDTSSDVDAITVFRERSDLTEDVKRKILSDNARRLYAL